MRDDDRAARQSGTFTLPLSDLHRQLRKAAMEYPRRVAHPAIRERTHRTPAMSSPERFGPANQLGRRIFADDLDDLG
jgi:hypothetical protein